MNEAVVLAGALSISVSIAAAAGCARRAPPPAPVPGPIASALLALAAELGRPPTEVADAWIHVREIAARAADRRRQTGGDAVAALTVAVFEDLGFAREVDDADLRFMLLPTVIAGRRGSCLGLSALYLAVAEALGVPLDGVLVPGHFFVRAPGPPPRNIELLHRGEVMPEQWYRTKYGPWPETAAATAAESARSPSPPSAYGRAVSATELLAVHWFNVGNLRRAAGDLPAAERAYARAAAGFPSLAEAHASLGVARQLQGRLAAAAAAYRAAARARPDLPGLTQNIALLAAEQAGRERPALHEGKPLAAPSIQ